MRRNHTVKFMATKEEKEMVMRNAINSGFGKPGVFLRHLALNYNFNMEQKINQTYSKICEMKEFLDSCEDLKMKTKKNIKRLHELDLSKYDWLDMFEKKNKN